MLRCNARIRREGGMGLEGKAPELLSMRLLDTINPTMPTKTKTESPSNLDPDLNDHLRLPSNSHP